MKTATFSALYENVGLNLPNSLVDEEIEELLKPYKEAAKKNKTTNTTDAVKNEAISKSL